MQGLLAWTGALLLFPVTTCISRGVLVSDPAEAGSSKGRAHLQHPSGPLSPTEVLSEAGVGEAGCGMIERG